MSRLMRKECGGNTSDVPTTFLGPFTAITTRFLSHLQRGVAGSCSELQVPQDEGDRACRHGIVEKTSSRVLRGTFQVVWASEIPGCGGHFVAMHTFSCRCSVSVQCQ